MQEYGKYFYEEHTCPINFIRIHGIAYNGESDPHGLFSFIEQVFMTCEYEAYKDNPNDREAYLRELFPQISVIR